MTEKYGKVWGETWPILQTPMVEFHRISIKNGYRCSTHKHEHKWNGFFVETGELQIHVKKKDYPLTDITTLKAGQFCAVKPGEYHWFQCIEDCVAFEIYWLTPITEDIQRESTGGIV